MSVFDPKRFSLYKAKLDLSQLPPAPAESSVQGSRAVPLDTSDPRYAEYFAELKRRIEEKWGYPEEAARKGQSGRGTIRSEVRKDGSVRTVAIVSSSGVRILDSSIRNAIRMAAPFPALPASVEEDPLPISINFTYTLSDRRALTP